MILEKTMLEYVLERDSTNKYANFLNLNLKTEMFVPCDDEGNVLDEPDSIGVVNDFYYPRALYQYQQAKEKVLFDGFYCVKMGKRQVLCNKNGLFESPSNLECRFKEKTIKSILTKKLTLTPAGKKLAGLI